MEKHEDLQMSYNKPENLVSSGFWGIFRREKTFRYAGRLAYGIPALNQ